MDHQVSEDELSALENELSKFIAVQKQAAIEEERIRKCLRRIGCSEPDSLLIIPSDTHLKVLRYLNPADIAKSDVCRHIRKTNEHEWHRLATEVYPCKYIDERSDKLKVLMYRKLGGRTAGKSFGRPMRVGSSGSLFATIPSMSGLNRSSSPSYNASYMHMQRSDVTNGEGRAIECI